MANLSLSSSNCPVYFHWTILTECKIIQLNIFLCKDNLQQEREQHPRLLRQRIFGWSQFHYRLVSSTSTKQLASDRTRLQHECEHTNIHVLRVDEWDGVGGGSPRTPAAHRRAQFAQRVERSHSRPHGHFRRRSWHRPRRSQWLCLTCNCFGTAGNKCLFWGQQKLLYTKKQ